MAEPALSPPLAPALAIAATACAALRAGTALDRALKRASSAAGAGDERLRAAAQDIAYQATRRRGLLDALIAQLAPRPPAAPVAGLLAVALSQLLEQRRASYAVVDQAVRAAKADARLSPAAGFVNGVLRNFLRQPDALIARAETDEVARFNAPAWWIRRLRETYPQHWQDILRAQSQPPPLVLRVNVRRIAPVAYLERLTAAGLAASRVGAAAIWLHVPRPVEAIPGFSDGLVSVQDAGAQLAAPWLDARDGQRVLDACAAPGGKTAHLAELAQLEIDAVELDGERARRIEANLARLGARAHASIRVLLADVADTQRYAGEAPYDRILLDAPCTAAGIVRRHPDIPWLRRDSDVAQLATRQARLLDAVWPLLAPAGRLLYVVCSLFPEEGALAIRGFLDRHPEARLAALAPGLDSSVQLLPMVLPEDGRFAAPPAGPLPSVHDGFFFALIARS